MVLLDEVRKEEVFTDDGGHFQSSERIGAIYKQNPPANPFAEPGPRGSQLPGGSAVHRQQASVKRTGPLAGATAANPDC